MNKPLLILKLGSSSIIKPDGTINDWLMDEVAAQLALLNQQYRLLLVSSGAVGFGRSQLKKFSGKLSERKAAAAIGNPILMAKYAESFSKHHLKIAQTLCERGHFSDRRKFLQLRETIETLWQNDIIPVANENDVVSSLELKFSDNDELATLMAIGFGAQALLIGTSVDGLLDADNRVVREINHFTEGIMSLATGEKSVFGLGGMISKITFARLATGMGIDVFIFNSQQPNGISDALAGKIGTQCKAKRSSVKARQKWLASGSIVSGRIEVDEGAGQALMARKSLLSVGVKTIISDFEKGEVIEIIINGNQHSLGVARAKLSSKELNNKLGQANIEVANASDIVLL
ncbi:MAG: glutamate 5-kinase [Bacteroidetes bacterium]|nr:glutamate 5-kinase [Bacteroidota bacterium]